MSPFAQEKKSAPGTRKLILIALAAGSFSIWYFDLYPEFSPVPTGSVETTSEDGMQEDQFMDMLKSPPGDLSSSSDSANDGSLTPPPMLDGDPLAAALADQTEPIESAFPEFADTPQNESQPAVDTGIRQASFDKPELPPELISKPAVLPAELAAILRAAEEWMQEGKILEAHSALSRIYWKKPQWRTELLPQLQISAAEIYANPRRHFAEPYFVQPGETLSDIAVRHKVPWQYLARLNRTSAKRLQAGQELKVLTGPFGAVIDLEEFELTVHAHGWFVRRYQIGIGADSRTPIGEYTIQDKLENPVWFRPGGGKVAADDPQNPLGEYWLGLGDHIGIHGTIDPDSIGRATSRGCIHLADDDIAEVFHLLGTGSPVKIRR